MNKILSLAMMMVALCGGWVQAQQAKPAEAPASREDVEKMMDALHVKENSRLAIDSMMGPMKSSFERMFRKDYPDMTQKELDILTGSFDDLLKDMPIDQMIEETVPIYQKHFSKADIEGVIAFYDSPVGRKFIAEQPAMMQESMEVTMRFMEQELPKMRKKMDARMQALREEMERERQSKTSKGPASSTQAPAH